MGLAQRFDNGFGALGDFGGRHIRQAVEHIDARIELSQEVGDLLFTVVNVARRLNVDPELALRGTNARFVARVERAEELAAAAGERWSGLPLEEQDRYYDLAKEETG